MINIIDVYNAVRDVCNKDQRGFVTPEVFSTFAGIAQQNIFNEMFMELSVANKARQGGIDPSRDKSFYKMIEEDLAYFIEQREMSDAQPTPPDGYDADANGEWVDPANDDASIFNKPPDLAKIISIRRMDDATPLDIVYNSETSERILNSNLSAPTAAFPVAVISRYIEIFPYDHNSVILKYYRQPKSINAYTMDVDLNSTPVYIEMSMGGAITMPDMLNSRHFELPDHYKNEVIIEITKMIGIRLRDNYLSSFSIAEEKAE